MEKYEVEKRRCEVLKDDSQQHPLENDHEELSDNEIKTYDYKKCRKTVTGHAIHSKESIMSMKKHDMEMKIKKTIYKIRGEDEDVESTLIMWMKFFKWVVIFTIVPTICAVILFALPVLDLNEDDLEVRKLSRSYAWIGHFWICMLFSFTQIMLVEDYVVVKVFESKFSIKERVQIIFAAGMGGVVAYFLFSLWANPVPYANIWAMNFFSTYCLGSILYIIKFNYMDDAEDESVQDLVIKGFINAAKVCSVCLLTILIYIAYYCGYDMLLSGGSKTAILLYTALLFVMKELQLKAFEKFYESFDPSNQPSGQWWTITLHSFFMTIVLSGDETSNAQMAILLGVDWLCAFYAIFNICKAHHEVLAKKELEELDEDEKEFGIIEKVKRKIFVKGKAFAATITQIGKKADLGKNRNITIHLVKDGQMMQSSGYLVLAEFAEFIVPCTYFCMLWAISYLPNYKYVMGIRSDEFGWETVEDDSKMWRNLYILIGIEFASFIFVTAVCKYAYDIHLLPVLTDLLEIHGDFWLATLIMSIFVFMAVRYEPWACDLTFQLDYLDNQ